MCFSLCVSSCYLVIHARMVRLVMVLLMVIRGTGGLWILLGGEGRGEGML